MEELNEIVLGEYRLVRRNINMSLYIFIPTFQLEKARNELISNWRHPGNIQSELLVPSKKSMEFGKKLDEALNRKR